MTQSQYMTKAQIFEGLENYSKLTQLSWNTWQYHNSNNERVIRYTRTDIVKIKPNGDIILNSGGWQTVTTKRKINQLLPSGFYLYQSKFQWFINDAPFIDGMKIVFDGKVILNWPTIVLMENEAETGQKK